MVPIPGLDRWLDAPEEEACERCGKIDCECPTCKACGYTAEDCPIDCEGRD